MASNSLKLLNNQNFKEGVANGLVLVDFYADWCGPCRMLTPIVEELAQEMSGKVTVVKVDTDQSTEIASEYDVTSIPTLILFKNGKLVKRVVGLRDLDSLRKMVEEQI